MTAKGYAGGKDIIEHYFGAEYDGEKMRKHVLAQMPDERCTKCHKDLFARGGSSAARKAHLEAVNSTEEPKPRCISCHDKMHERDKKLFSPD